MQPSTVRTLVLLGAVALLGTATAVIALSLAGPGLPSSQPVETVSEGERSPIGSAERRVHDEAAYAPPTAPPSSPGTRSPRDAGSTAASAGGSIAVPTPAVEDDAPRLDADELAEAEAEIEAYREAAEARLQEQLLRISRARVDDASYEAALRVLERETEHQVMLERDRRIGGLDPASAQIERDRIRAETNVALDEALGADLREEVRQIR